MTLLEFRDVLCSIKDVPVFHGKAHKAAEYIIWQEVGGGLGFEADGVSAEGGIRIAVDFYTKAEYSDIPEKIAALLSGFDEICFDGPVIDFDEESGYTHYSFDAEVCGGG